MKDSSRTAQLFAFVLFSLAGIGGTQLPAAEPAPGLIIRLKQPAGAAKTASSRLVLTEVLNRAGVQQQVVQVAQVSPAAAGTPLERCFVLSLQDDVENVLNRLATDEQVEYVQINHRLKVHEITPDDSLFSEQWGMQAMRAPQAWDFIAKGEPVPVAVIDTGVDYRHPDLDGQLWVNPGEDLDGNGRVDESDFNGIDDDGNGFVDDLRGWDFTDAPSFIDSGDYADRDNDPDDEHGHGTAVAGIIVARANNGIGIAGMAFQNRVMNLRAGTSLGFLEEDDVAAAIIYAVANGARVINMSFGDVVVSPMLRDVIRYAWSQGVVLVASSGNSSTDQPHYPSGFQETISVGAIVENRVLASFSNFGTTIDVVAPGQNIPTTRPGGEYGRFAGTSASAPFISAAASLILRRNPEFGPEQVRTVLIAAAKDLGEPGWDRFYGSGLPDLVDALQIQQAGTVSLISPSMDAGFAGEEIAVIATATSAFSERIELSYGAGDNPETWFPVAELKNEQIVEDTLALWDVSALEDTTWTLRLQLFTRDGRVFEDKNRIILDRTAPRLSVPEHLPMLDGDHPSVLISFASDDITSARIFWRPVGSADPFSEIVLNYVTRNHRFNFSSLLSGGREVEYYLLAQNRSGLITSTDDEQRQRLAFSDENLFKLEFATESLAAPAGLLLDKLSDFDGDGDRELVMSVYDEGWSLGPMAVYEATPAGFAEVFRTEHLAIPRDVGDSDGDGLREILAGAGQVSLIYEAVEKNAFPSVISWVDSSDFWAARFADTDGDGRVEIIGRQGNVWQVREYDGAGDFTLTAELPNFTPGRNLTGVPHAEVGDFDGDGRSDILLGDYDGDIYMYEIDGQGRSVPVWSDSLPLFDTADFIASGDFDGDGITDFAAAAHSDPALNSESEFDARHWLVRLYQSTGDNNYEVRWQKRLYGFYPPGDFDAGLAAGDVDGDGRDELLISLFPDMYVVQFQPQTNAFEPVWHFRTVRSNTVIVDTLYPGRRQMIANTSSGPAAFELSSSPDRLPVPVRVTARPLDAGTIVISWQSSGAGNQFRLFRGTSADSLSLLAIVTDELFTDSTVTAGVTYFYAVTARDTTGVLTESRLSAVVSALPGKGPALLQARYIPQDHVQLLFSEPLAQEEARRQGNYRIDDVHPLSVVLAGGGREVLLTFEALSEGSHTVQVRSITDLDQTPIDPSASSAEFFVPGKLPRFYLTGVEIESPRLLAVRFNQSVDPLTAARAGNYSLSTPLVVGSVSLDSVDPRRVLLYLAQGKIAALGREYLVQVSGVTSRSGVALRTGEGDVIGFTVTRDELNAVFAYPNPFHAGNDRLVTIAGLPRVAFIQIFDEHGRPVRELTEADGNGGVSWDGLDAAGNPVPSGIYLVRVRANAGEQYTKIAVVR